MSHDIDECYAVYNETVRKARKAHECDACERTIRPGDYYCRAFWIFDGSRESVKRCGACQRIHEHLRELAPGEMWPDERLSCGLDYEDEWGAQPSDSVQALALLDDAAAGQLLGPLGALRKWVEEAEKRGSRNDYRLYPAVWFQRMATIYTPHREQP